MWTEFVLIGANEDMAKGDLISRSELLKEFDLNGDRLDPIFVRSRIVQARSISDAEIKEKAIDEFAERLKTSQDAYSWCCADGYMEYCNGDHCEDCMKDFKEKIDKIAKQLKGGAE